MTYTQKIAARIAALCLSLILMCGAAFAATGKQIALVIGNSNYDHIIRLPNTINDAKLISKTLRKAGFEVVEGIDLNKTEMAATIDQFTEKAYNAELAVVYFAGHGLQVDGKNYLMPIDAVLNSPAHLQTRAFDVDQLIAALPVDPGIGVVILDACRNNPLARKFASSLPVSRSVTVSSGFAPVQTKSTGSGTGGILIAYATDPGSVALDGNGINSPYTAALAKHLTTPGVSLQSALTRVRGDVTKATKGQQRPWHNASLGREVFLGGETRVATLTKISPANLEENQSSATLVLVPAPTKAQTIQPQLRKVIEPVAKTSESDTSKWAVERRFWDEVSKRNTIAHYQAYLNQYPNGQFNTIADLNIRSLLEKKISNSNGRNTVATNQPNIQVAAIANPAPGSNVTSTTRAVKVLPESLLSTVGTRDTEAAINLNRNQRTDLQLRLTALGYNTRGADGKLGPNSRRAIGTWQQRLEIPATTYLTNEQWAHLQQESNPLMAAIYAERTRITRTVAPIAKKRRIIKKRRIRKAKRRVRPRRTVRRERYVEPNYREERRYRERERRRRNNNAAAGAIIGGIVGGVIACKVTHTC